MKKTPLFILTLKLLTLIFFYRSNSRYISKPTFLLKKFCGTKLSRAFISSTDWAFFSVDTWHQISTLSLLGKDLNCGFIGSIGNTPLFVPLPKSRIRSMISNLQTDDSRKENLRMCTALGWDRVKFHHSGLFRAMFWICDKTVWVAHHFSHCSTAFTQHKGLFCFSNSPSPASE